ncbi:uncharacterized protein KNAG_0D03060 [Huiozyma naganishii CBS 8797]|uniref:Uncharacterized protein n=1 Tax=Huiozyma naganishii (strain ATCC MYA-139 / BCRC 22969 / CBS 8797 / KCTC 17520 / NBRC 10181 / NCYC 3082 / Yp74L-3) TaxID=1071383 RepID=J7S5X0_HUIN7|nr:hypothetical protein KNAG_0D03060 [Kazachstania naganishii CBS 8797]CCK70054.1 hypothetical protein KNAG_0D03060 [Kazachstania naganishii CBS 8797]
MPSVRVATARLVSNLKRLLRGKTVTGRRAWVLVLTGIIGLCFFALSIKTHADLFSNNDNAQVGRVVVTEKEFLSNLDLTETLSKMKKKWLMSRFNNELLTKRFRKENVVGYVSNIDLSKTQAYARLKPDDRNSWIEDSLGCKEMQQPHVLESYVWDQKIKIDIYNVRNMLISQNHPLRTYLISEEEKHMSTKDILRENWYAFGSSAVWLEKENCYLVYTRLMYSKEHKRNIPFMSLIYGQAYDRDWNLLPGKMIRYNDIAMPDVVKQEVEKLKYERENTSCDHVKHDAKQFEECLTIYKDMMQDIDVRLAALQDRYYISYPTVIDIPMVINHVYNGPEDPRSILHKNQRGEEPLLLFNMETEGYRRIHSFYPHRKINSLVRFESTDMSLSRTEKNWAPFLTDPASENDRFPEESIHFVYNLMPLIIFRCSLFDGKCRTVFKDHNIEDASVGLIRGGTQFVKLPSVIPEVEGRAMWVAFTKSHVKECGCTGAFYRPMLTVMVEKDGAFNIETITPVVDFKMDVLNWSLDGTSCVGLNNVLSPNSISSWDVISQDAETGQYEDYMTVIVSESDVNSKLVVVKGVLNFVIDIYRKFQVRDTYTADEESALINKKQFKCTEQDLRDFCALYSDTH